MIDTMTASKFGRIFANSGWRASRREDLGRVIAVTIAGELAGTWTPVGVALEDVELPTLHATDGEGDDYLIPRYNADPEPVELAKLALEIAELRADFEAICARLTKTPPNPDHDRAVTARRAHWANVKNQRAKTQVDDLLAAVRAGIENSTKARGAQDE